MQAYYRIPHAYLRCLFATGLVALATSTPVPAAGPADVPDEWIRQVEQEIASREYHITQQDAAWQAPNRAQGFRSFFEKDGIRLVPRRGDPSWDWGLTWVGYGRGGRSWTVPDAVLTPDGDRIDYARGDLVEWYVNGPRGLEQGFTLPVGPEEFGSRSGTRPAHEPTFHPTVPGIGRSVPLPELVHLELSLRGRLVPVFGADGQSIEFLLNGIHVLHYDELVVTDDDGRTLPAWFEPVSGPSAGGIRIVVDARGAAYPITVDPLATSAAWTTESGQANARLGRSVATAGDVDGDGYSDVLVGAHLFDNGEVDEGAAFLFLGSAAGLPMMPDWTADGDQANAQFAFSVATAGDVDGDGYSDIVIGAPLHDNGATDEGAAFLFLGSAAGLPMLPDWTADGNQVGAEFGYSVGAAGDVDGDGFGDVIVGARLYDNPLVDEGGAFVFYGSSGSIPSASPDWTGQANQASAQFGWSVGTAGDVNKDGYADVVVGARDYDGGMPDEGAAFLWLGSATGPTVGLHDWSVEGNQPQARLGGSVGTAGDVNGDGYADVIVGAALFDNGQPNEGIAFVYHGSASIPSSTDDWRGEIDQAGALVGAAVATAGDVNGDGYADVIVGAEKYANGEMDEGGAWVYLGSSGGLATTPAWSSESDQVGASLGVGVGCAGDVNGDGLSDVIVGGRFYDNGESNEGQAWLYLGGPSGPSTSEDWSAESDEVAAQLGFSVASAGDVDGDGYADVIVGLPFYDDGGTDRGNAWVYLGSPTGLPSGTPHWVGSAGVDLAEYGGSVASAGDVNGDGYSDVIIGAGNYDCGQIAEGAAFIHFGSSSGVTGTTPDVTFEFDLAGARVGSAVASAGDVNGDGFSDVVIGAPGYTNGEAGEGGAFLWHGYEWTSGTAPAIGTADWTAESDQPSAEFGSTVATAGDVDGDGFSDVVVGAWNYSNGETAEGAAWVYLGSKAGLSDSAAWQQEGEQPGAWFGWSAATAGDVNGDGNSDVVVGAPSFDNGESDEGSAFLFLGELGGLSAAPAWTAEADEINASYGDSVGAAGDVNGDGFADVLVGTGRPSTGGSAELFPGSAAGLASDPAWTVDGGVAGPVLNTAVASAGDVNGDGFADLIVGVRGYANTEVNEGGAFVYHGSAGGRVRLPRQRQLAGPTIAQLGRSDDTDSFDLRGKGISPFGRVRQRAQVEVKPLGTPFDGSGTILTSWTSAPETNLVLTIAGLTNNTVYHWRARPLFDPATSPFQQHGPWFTIPWNGWQEADLRTAPIADLEVVASDAADPALLGCTIEWTFTVTNHGPDTAESMDLSVFPAPGSIALTDIVAWTPSCGIVTGGGGVSEIGCHEELIPVGGEFTLELSIKPTSTGTFMADATVALDGGVDPDAGNDTDSVDTTLVDPAIGDVAWNDADGDGIQGAGEVGEPNVLVALYDSGGSPLDAVFTDASGAYGFTGLTCGSDYSLRFIAPPNQILTLQDQGGDDAADSDADPLTGETGVITLLPGLDLTGWDAGVLPCVAPDEPVYISDMRLTDDGFAYPIIDYQDPSQPVQVTGYNIYRSSDASLPKSSWPLVASDVVDMDAATPDNQWVDTSGDVSPTGIWYYNVAAYNNRCAAVGPL